MGAALRLEPQDAGEESTWGYESINRGPLGSSTLLTSTLTLVYQGDSCQVKALWDSGSESSFFHPALLPFATNTRKQAFKLETLSPSATQPEVVHGVEATFDVAIPGTNTLVQLSLLQHEGLQLRNMKLKAKLLTCSKQFTVKHDLVKQGLTELCSTNQHCHKGKGPK